MDAFEKRKNREQNKKYNKQIMEYKKKEKSMNEKSESIHTLDDEKGGRQNNRTGLTDKDGIPVKSPKRRAMDKKYSFGSKEKKEAKKNDRRLSRFIDMKKYY